MRRKQNGGWKVSDADWFYVSFYDPSWFFYDPSWSESNFILFFYSIRAHPTRTSKAIIPFGYTITIYLKIGSLVRIAIFLTPLFSNVAYVHSIT